MRDISKGRVLQRDRKNGTKVKQGRIVHRSGLNNENNKKNIK